MSKSSRKNWGLASCGVMLVASVLLSASSGYKKLITSTPDSLEIAPFVEPNFPFISTSLDARKLGSGFPADNQAARTLAIRLGDSAYVCFDTDLLRWSVAWTRKFMPMNLLAQVSYDDFFNKSNKLATIAGIPQIATGDYAGWVALKGNPPTFAVPAPKKDWLPLPATEARWNGVYTYGDKVVLNYTIGQTPILERPGSVDFSGETAFTRTFKGKPFDRCAGTGPGGGDEWCQSAARMPDLPTFIREPTRIPSQPSGWRAKARDYCNRTFLTSSI